MRAYKVFASIIMAVLSTSANCIASEVASEHECAVVDIQSEKGVSGQENKNKVVGIYQLFSDWQDAVNDGDAKKIASLVTEDAEFWSNAAPPLKGRSALEEAFKPFLAKYSFSQDYECYELIVRGDTAFVRGFERNTKIPREGGAAILTMQRAFSVIRQTDSGEWLFGRGMTNLPADS